MLMVTAKDPDEDLMSEFMVAVKAKELPALPLADLELFYRLMAALVAKNETLLTAADNCPQTADWFSLQPLSQSEVEVIRIGTNSAEVAVLRLVDHGLLSVSHHDVMAYLYPSSPLLLYREHAVAVQRRKLMVKGCLTATVAVAMNGAVEEAEKAVSDFVKHLFVAVATGKVV